MDKQLVKTARHRGFIIEVSETDTGFPWECKKEDGTIISFSDNEFYFDGEDVSDAIEQAKEGIDDFIDQ